MKFKLLICLLFSMQAFCQKGTIHLCFVTDRTDKLRLIIPQEKEAKIKNMFNTIRLELGYDLKHHYFGFDPSETINRIEKLGKMGTNDIVVLYYIGRGSYPNAPKTKLPVLEFQDSKGSLTINDLRTKLNELKNKPRLTLVIADCDNRVPTRNAFESSESDSSNNKLIEQTPAIEKKDDSLHIKKLTEAELLYFNATIESLYKLSNGYRMNNAEDKMNKRLTYQLNRFSEYVRHGFPKASVPLTNAFEQLPPISDKPTFNRNFDCVVDSMFKKRSILLPDEPLNIYLDQLLNLPEVTGNEDGRSTTTPESTRKPFIQKLFLSQCGEIVITNGADQARGESADYTGYIESNFNRLLEKGKFNKIDNLTIDLLFNDMNNGNAIYGKTTTLGTCPNGTQDFKTPVYSKIPTSDDVNKLFVRFVEAKDTAVKNKLLADLKEMFTENASVLPQVSKSAAQTIVDNQATPVNINTYLKNLYADSDSVKGIQVPPSYIVRNDNFSKIVQLRIVEYR